MPTIRYFELRSNKKSVANRKFRHKQGTICCLQLHRMAYQKVGMKVAPTVVPNGNTKGIHYGTLKTAVGITANSVFSCSKFCINY